MTTKRKTRQLRISARASIRRAVKAGCSLHHIAGMLETGAPSVMRWRDGTLPTAAMARLILEKLA